MAGLMKKGYSDALIERQMKQLPYRTNPTRNINLFKPRQDMGCSEFDFNKALDRALSPYKAAGKLTYLESGKPGERGDVRFHYPWHPDRIKVPGWGLDRWAYNQTKDGSTTIKESLEANIPVVGVINLEYVQPEGTRHSHLISYVLRRRGGTNELFLLEPYDTDILVGDVKNGAWLGIGLRPGWRDDIRGYFETKMDASPLALIAPMKGALVEYFDLTKRDAGEGQCASWAIKMLEAVAAIDLNTVSGYKMFMSIRPLQEGGRRRKTMRSKRTKRRGTRHARVR